MTLFVAIKDPEATLDYTVDWAPFLGADTITSSDWVAPLDLTIESESQTNSTTTVWLSGGDLGQTYEIVNSVTSAGGRIDDRTIYLTIYEK